MLQSQSSYNRCRSRSYVDLTTPSPGFEYLFGEIRVRVREAITERRDAIFHFIFESCVCLAVYQFDSLRRAAAPHGGRDLSTEMAKFRNQKSSCEFRSESPSEDETGSESTPVFNQKAARRRIILHILRKLIDLSLRAARSLSWPCFPLMQFEPLGYLRSINGDKNA